MEWPADTDDLESTIAKPLHALVKLLVTDGRRTQLVTFMGHSRNQRHSSNVFLRASRHQCLLPAQVGYPCHAAASRVHGPSRLKAGKTAVHEGAVWRASPEHARWW